MNTVNIGAKYYLTNGLLVVVDSLSTGGYACCHTPGVVDGVTHAQVGDLTPADLFAMLGLDGNDTAEVE